MTSGNKATCISFEWAFFFFDYHLSISYNIKTTRIENIKSRYRSPTDLYSWSHRSEEKKNMK